MNKPEIGQKLHVPNNHREEKKIEIQMQQDFFLFTFLTAINLRVIIFCRRIETNFI